MIVSSASLLHQSQALVCVTETFRVLLSQLCFCPPPVSHHTLNACLGVSSWLVEDRGVCSLSHLHPLQAVVFTEHCLGIAHVLRHRVGLLVCPLQGHELDS